MQLNVNRVKKITSQFSKKKILVFGDVGVDKYTLGKVSRISPEAPIPIIEVVATELKLGLAANVAANITALSGTVFLTGVVGDDPDSGVLKSLMKKNNMDSNYLVHDKSRQTTVKERVVAEFQQVVRIDHETRSKVAAKVLQQLWKKIRLAMNECDAVIIEDYAKGIVEVSICRQIMSLAEEKKIPVFVDPNSKSPIMLYHGCMVMTPNASETEALSGIKIDGKESLYQAGFKLLSDTHARIVIITLGKDGMAIFVAGSDDAVMIPTFAREVYDVSGAGDTTIAALALSMLSGADVVEAALIANHAAGIVVGKRGTATTSIKEIHAWVEMVNALIKRNPE